jgi:hypothetical protein
LRRYLLWTARVLLAASCGLIAGCTTAQRETVVHVRPLPERPEGPVVGSLDVAGAMSVTADELYRVYSQNLIILANPNQRFLNRRLLVSGVVNGVIPSARSHGYVELRTRDKDAFTYVELGKDGVAGPLGGLQPGAAVKLLCVGDGMIAGSPLLRACRLVQAAG